MALMDGQLGGETGVSAIRRNEPQRSLHNSRDTSKTGSRKQLRDSLIMTRSRARDSLGQEDYFPWHDWAGKYALSGKTGFSRGEGYMPRVQGRRGGLEAEYTIGVIVRLLASAPWGRRVPIYWCASFAGRVLSS